MAGRTYGPAPSQAAPGNGPETKAAGKPTTEAKPKAAGRGPGFFAKAIDRLKSDRNARVAALSCVGIAGIVIAAVLVAMMLFGPQQGYRTPEGAVEAFASSLSCDRPESAVLDTFLPRARETGYSVDTMDVAGIRRTAVRDGARLSGARATRIEPLGAGVVDELNRGMARAYEDADAITEAAKVAVAVDVARDGGEPVTATLTAIAAKSGNRWYVYTGEPVSASGDVGFDATFYGIAPDGGTEALAELRTGAFQVDGLDVSMPVDYNAITGLFTIEPSRKDYPLAGNQGAMHVPVVMANPEYDPECVSVGISNTDVDGQGTKAMSECAVTNLAIRAATADGLPSPDVQLPGGVSFGTSHADVVAAYGEMERYVHDAGTDGYNRYFEQVPGATETYYVAMDERGYNRIYLSFRDGGLAGVQWYLYDLRPGKG